MLRKTAKFLLNTDFWTYTNSKVQAKILEFAFKFYIILYIYIYIYNVFYTNKYNIKILKSFTHTHIYIYVYDSQRKCRKYKKENIKRNCTNDYIIIKKADREIDSQNIQSKPIRRINVSSENEKCQREKKKRCILW